MAKDYGELLFTDNFMFCKVIGSNPELSRNLLERILEKKIRKVDIKATEKTIDVTPGSKSIRMDVYLDDDAGTVYDLEMQTTEKKNLPKRLRYYQGMMDLNLIEKGQDYDELPETVILFVCTFDFFKKGLPFYVFQNRCEAMPELLLGDGSRKVFVNPGGSREGLSKETASLLDYIRDGKPADDFTEKLEQAVEKARMHKEGEVEYMQWRAIEMDMNIEKKEAVAAARDEGIAEGEKRGRNEGNLKRLIGQVCKKYGKRLAVSEAAEQLECDVAQVQKVYDAIEQTGTAENIDQIYAFIVGPETESLVIDHHMGEKR